MPIVHQGVVVDNKKVGRYHLITATAAEIPKEFKPGNFVAVAIGDERSSLILRRAFSIYQVNDRGVYGGTVDIVVDPHGPGTDFIANLKRNDPINLVGPLGKPFSLPKNPVPCVLVGGGYGAAPLFSLAESLTKRGCRVDFVIGASTAEKLFGMLEARRLSTTLTITTDDGSSGQIGKVTDVLPHPVNGIVNIVEKGGLKGDNKHPILIDGEWKYAENLNEAKHYKAHYDTLYNLEIDGDNPYGSDHNFIIDGNICSGLGDNISGIKYITLNNIIFKP